jgi:hypothetical protein
MKSILKLSRIFNGDGHCALLKTGAEKFVPGPHHQVAGYHSTVTVTLYVGAIMAIV